MKKAFGRFPSKREAKANIERIAKQYLNAGPVPAPDADDIHDLLDHHPDAVHKIGPGVKYFRIGTNGWGGWCIFVVRIDDSEVPFSVKKALSGKPQTPKAVRIETLRKELWPNTAPRQLLLDSIAANPDADYTPDKPAPGREKLRDRELAERLRIFYRSRRV